MVTKLQEQLAAKQQQVEAQDGKLAVMSSETEALQSNLTTQEQPAERRQRIVECASERVSALEAELSSL